jgi:3-hydroxyacyl-[acyl-carrier-protein] dehydratase
VRFYLVDRVDAFEPARSVQARKLTSRAEAYWEVSPNGAHGPDADVVMPPPLVLEALCQAGAWLVMISTACRQRAALLSIGAVRFLDDVRPGDVLLLEGHVESMGDEVAVLSGRVTVDGRAVLEADEIMCALIETGELQDPAETERLRQQIVREGGR